MKLYGALASPFVARCVLMARYMGVDLPLESVPGGMRSDYHLSLHPIGKIPAFEDGDVKIGESEVICEYLEDKFPDKALRPGDIGARAKSRMLSRYADCYLMTALGPLFAQMRADPKDEAAIKTSLEDIGKALDAMEAVGVATPYAVGAHPSLADCTLLTHFYWLMQLAPAFGEAEPLAGRPKLAAWWAAISASEHGAKMLADMQTSMDEFRARSAT